MYKTESEHDVSQSGFEGKPSTGSVMLSPPCLALPNPLPACATHALLFLCDIHLESEPESGGASPAWLLRA